MASSSSSSMSFSSVSSSSAASQFVSVSELTNDAFQKLREQIFSTLKR